MYHYPRNPTLFLTCSHIPHVTIIEKVIGEITTNIRNMKILQVFNVETVTSERTGNDYCRVQFRAATIDEKGNSLFSGLEKGTRIVFPGEEPQLGDRFAGAIVHFKTTPYMIGEREVDKCTVVVFEGENGVDLANKMLEQQGHNACVLDSAGNKTKKLKKIIKEKEKIEEEED